MVHGSGGRRAEVQRWSTEGVDAADALEHWRQIRRSAYVDVVCDFTTPDLRGEVVKGEYGSFALTDKRAAGDHARRGKRSLAQGREEHETLYAIFQIAGTGVLSQAGRTATVRPGSFVVYNSTLPFSMYHGGPYHQVIVHLDADSAYPLSGVRRDDDVLAVSMPCEGAMSAVAAFFVNLAATQESDPVGAQNLAPHASALATTLLAQAARTRHPDLPDFLRRDQVQTFIRTHLADPDLDAESIAAGAHLSRRSLYRLYEGADHSVMQLVRALRLDTAKQLLDRHPHRAVGVIARETGFRTPSNFHRAFREDTGLTPVEYRDRRS